MRVCVCVRLLKFVRSSAAKMSYFEQLWAKSCERYDVSSDLATHWHKLIAHKYSSEPNRHQHNLNLLDKKCKFLCELQSTLHFSEYLIFTLAFQYYHFDSIKLCTEMNCAAFRQFYGDSGINDVSTICLSV